MHILSTSLFGVIGILSRYGIDKAVAVSSGGFPLSTFIINILGCFLAGALVACSEQSLISPNLQTALMVGFCGGFTTFSAYGVHTLTLLERGRFTPALGFFLLSPVLGLAAAYLALALARRVFAG